MGENRRHIPEGIILYSSVAQTHVFPLPTALTCLKFSCFPGTSAGAVIPDKELAPLLSGILMGKGVILLKRENVGMEFSV